MGHKPVRNPAAAAVSPVSKSTRARLATYGLAAAAALSLTTVLVPASAATTGRMTLPASHLPLAVYRSPMVGATAASQAIEIEFALKPRNADQIPALRKALKDPSNPMFGKYLTPEQYKTQFGRTPAEVAKVVAYAQRHNLTIVEVKSNNLFVRARGTVADINSAFGITLKDYVSQDSYDKGRTYHAPDREPTVDSDIAPMVQGILGLNNAAVAHHDAKFVDRGPLKYRNYRDALAAPRSNSDNPPVTQAPHSADPNDDNDDLDPYDTSNIYNMAALFTASTPINGTGQVIGLAEQGSYTQNDVNTWQDYWSYPEIDVYPVSVDGFDTSSTPDSDAAGETTLDIDMVQTFGWGASAVQVYEGPLNTTISSDIEEFADIFYAMANASTRPNVISVSYGFPEVEASSSDILVEGETLDQLALQGQTVCVASGDTGAYAYQPSTSEPVNVEDPGSQDTVVCVGGTDLADMEEFDSHDNPYEVWAGESSWFDSSDKARGKIGTGSGGGISKFWSLPFFQQGAFSTSVNTQGSTTMRNTPDVTMFGDFDDGYYSIIFTDPSSGNQSLVGSNGTSAASPLWAGLLADVNQERAINKLPNIGEADPDIYTVAESSNYGSDFHDIKDGSTNGYYKAVTGYDNADGWGSPGNGTHLVQDLGKSPQYIEWGLSVSETAVTSGKNLTATVTLPLPASQDDKFHITTSNSSKTFTVPTAVTVKAGSSSATFTVTSVPQNSSTTAGLIVNFFGYSRTVNITVNPASFSALSLSPTSVKGGSSSTGTVTLHGTAGPAGITVNLKSSNANAATVPSSVTVTKGNTTATFKITTKSVSSNTNVTITASTPTQTKTATLTVTH